MKKNIKSKSLPVQPESDLIPQPTEAREHKAILKKIESETPSIMEIAKLAAMWSATYVPDRIISPEDAVGRAIRTWKVAKSERELLIASEIREELERKQQYTVQAELLKPETYPVKFSQFLRLVVGGKYMQIRINLYKQFLRKVIDNNTAYPAPPEDPPGFQIVHPHVRNLNLDPYIPETPESIKAKLEAGVEERLSVDRKLKISNLEDYLKWALPFYEWLQMHHTRQNNTGKAA